MLAAMTVTADSDRRDYCVVVVKGTFLIDHAGAMRLAPEQAPLGKGVAGELPRT